MAQLKLPRLQIGFRICDPETGNVSPDFILFWQTFAEAIESNINNINFALEAAGIALDAADAANAAAASANAAAAAAQGAADSTASATALSNSFPTGVTITAIDAGTDATINISAHNRTYATVPQSSVAVSSGSITGLAYSTRYFIYYDQPSRAGGTVTYIATTMQSDVAQIGNRHSVGTVATPAAAGGPTNGDGTSPPGGSYDTP